MATMLLHYNEITKETAKAICLNINVSWGNGSQHQRDVWFPKSKCQVKDAASVVVDKTILRAKENELAFNGLAADFDALTWED